MTEIADLEALVEQAVKKGAGTLDRLGPVITKELLHYDILFALESNGLLDSVTFQGGTSLRLCYGSSRYSEDLDFAGGWDFNAKQLINMKACIERYIGERYGLEVTVKEPREVLMEPHGKSIRVHKWQIRIMTAPERPDLPKQMIKIEVAGVPAHTRVPQLLRKNYEFMPDGYDGMVITVESREEIMADKLIALVDCPYLRHRDIWDLQWLSQQGVQTDAGLIRRKLTDYKIEDYAAKADRMIERLPEIAHSDEFTKQMGRFIQQDVRERTLGNGKFLTAMQNEVMGLLRKAKKSAL